jgi:hypothetical protein
MHPAPARPTRRKRSGVCSTPSTPGTIDASPVQTEYLRGVVDTLDALPRGDAFASDPPFSSNLDWLSRLAAAPDATET